jgi:hypothetical protein
MIAPTSRGKILKWTPYRNPAGTMAGFLSAELPSGMIINDMRLMIGPKGGRWIATPSEKRLDADGKPVIGPEGKPVYNQFIEFRDKASRDRFQDAILELLRSAHPELFDGGAP